MSDERGQEASSAGLNKAATHNMRKLLQAAGLRFTISRLKIMEALIAATSSLPDPGKGVSPRDLHLKLSEAGEPVSPESVFGDSPALRKA